MIPKILHFIWVGEKELPADSIIYLNKFKNLYTDYKILLWKDFDVIEHNMIPDFLKEYYYNNFSPAFKADILRYLILNKYGGLYFDTDFEPLKKIPEHFLSFDFLGGIQPNGETAIGFIGSIKETKLLTDVINFIPNSINKAKNENYYVNDAIYKITGPEFFDRLVKKYKTDDCCFFFTPDYFYPFSWTEKNKKYNNLSETFPLAYAVHHWDKSWA